MKMQWLEGTKGEEREKLKQYILGNTKVLDILVRMLYNDLREAESVSVKDYDSPSWAYLQAHLNGKKEVIRHLIDLCEVSKG